MVRYDWRQRYRNAKDALDELNQIFEVNTILLSIPNLFKIQLNEKGIFRRTSSSE
jgi:serine/threonine-protein kinase